MLLQARESQSPDLPGGWLGSARGACCIVGYMEDTIVGTERERIHVSSHGS